MTDIGYALQDIVSSSYGGPVTEIIIYRDRIEYSKGYSGWMTKYSDYGDFTGNVYLSYGGFQQVREITNYNPDVWFSGNVYGIRINNESYNTSNYSSSTSGYTSSDSKYKTIQEWCRKGEFNAYPNAEKRLTDMGFTDNEHHEVALPNLKKVLDCEDIARQESQIRYSLSGEIKEVHLFTPQSDENLDCGVILMSNNDVWIVAYKPLKNMANKNKELVVEKAYSGSSYWDSHPKFNELTEKLQWGRNPILAVATPYKMGYGDIDFTQINTSPYVVRESRYFSTGDNPDQYVLPLDIVERVIGDSDFFHFAIYLGNGWVCNYQKNQGAAFDTWQGFLENRSITVYIHHTPILFKDRSDIVEHIAKAIKSQYGKKDITTLLSGKDYRFLRRNCEQFANRLVKGINISQQVENLKPSERRFNLEGKLSKNKYQLDDLVRYGDSSSERYRICDYYRQACQANQVQRPKFSERQFFAPKPWCRIQ